MFIALEQATGRRVDITAIPNPRAVLPLNGMICQRCGSVVTIRAGEKTRPHFAHRSQAICQGLFDAHPETPEHAEAKRTLATLLQHELGAYTSAPIEYEVPIPEAKRIADLMLKLPCGWWVAFECQLAHITPATLEQRSRDYLSAGVHVFWWLGKAADRSENREWVARHQRHVFLLTFEAGTPSERGSDIGQDSSAFEVMAHQLELESTLWGEYRWARVPYRANNTSFAAMSFPGPILSAIHEVDVRRMFELHDALTARQIKAGLGTEVSKSNHISGMLGSLNNSRMISQTGTPRGVWYRVQEPANLFARYSSYGKTPGPWYRPLPESAIPVIKHRATAP